MAEPVRGELYLCRFDPARGSEQRGTRPALVVERTTFASVPRKRHVLVAAITSNPRCERLPFCVPVDPGKGTGLDRRSYVNASHLHAFSKERLEKRLGRLSPTIMGAVDEALRVILDL
jgi:mRNA interferase MazF